MTMVVFIVRGGQRTMSHRSCWQIERHGGFMKQTILKSFLDAQFCKWMKVRLSTFKSLGVLWKPIVKEDTRMRDMISIETKVVGVLSQLAIGNSFIMIVDLFQIGLNTIFKIVRESCKSIRIWSHWFFKNRYCLKRKHLLQKLKYYMALLSCLE